MNLFVISWTSLFLFLFFTGGFLKSHFQSNNHLKNIFTIFYEFRRLKTFGAPRCAWAAAYFESRVMSLDSVSITITITNHRRIYVHRRLSSTSSVQKFNGNSHWAAHINCLNSQKGCMDHKNRIAAARGPLIHIEKQPNMKKMNDWGFGYFFHWASLFSGSSLSMPLSRRQKTKKM